MLLYAYNSSHERVIPEQWFLTFSFWTKNFDWFLHFVEIFVQLIVISVAEKILSLFAWLFDEIRFELGDGILFVQSFWLDIFFSSWWISEELKFWSN